MIVDRALQRRILVTLREGFPEDVNLIEALQDVDQEVLFANLFYLDHHRLLVHGIRPTMNSAAGGYRGSKITASGIDFLEDDGGVTAILRTVTVKLHADTIRELLAKKVEETDLPEDEKSTLRKAVEGLPAAALTAGAGDLMKMGLDHAPGAIAYIRTLAGWG